jgi:hypothetical protein
MIKNVHHNPVRRGLAERASDDRWSSADYRLSRGEYTLDRLLAASRKSYAGEQLHVPARSAIPVKPDEQPKFHTDVRRAVR